MKKLSLCCILALSSLSNAYAADDATAPSEYDNFCFFSGSPPAELKYTVIKRVKAAKGTYGAASQLLVELAERAKKQGGDAIINYSGAQRFGFWPWRMVRPVVTGESIKWTGAAPDCEQAGGSTLATIKRTNLAPGRSGPTAEPEAPPAAPEAQPEK